MSMQRRQTKKSYIKHTEGSSPLGKSSCQQAMSMEIAKKSARASDSYERYLLLHRSEPVTFHEYPELNLAKLSMHSKKEIYTPPSPSVCSVLTYSTWKLNVHLAVGHCSPKTGQCRSQNNFPLQLKFLILFNSTALKESNYANPFEFSDVEGSRFKAVRQGPSQFNYFKYFVENFPNLNTKLLPSLAFFCLFTVSL